jgi:hypothetical protein
VCGDGEAAALQKANALLGIRLPFLAIEIAVEEIVDRFVGDASPVTLGSKGMWDRFKRLPYRRPFMFFSVMPLLRTSASEKRWTD